MDTIQALSILKPTEKTAEGLKKAYRKACLIHHPDKGGNLEIMKLVNAAYDWLKNSDSWWTGEQSRAAAKSKPLTETMAEIIEKLKGLTGIKIEVIGSWLWVSGNTYSHKDLLKEMKFKFSGPKKSWYYHEDKYRKTSKKNFSLDEIKVMFGSEEIRTENRNTLAA
jgi:hypothetical protein